MPASKKLILTLLTAVIVAAGRTAPAQQQRVRGTVHNLSTSGPGTIRALSETEICVFCHTPHRGASDVKPLWNRSTSQNPYTIYQSSSMKARVGQPTGSSKLCLSCHDGTIALGSVLSRPLPIPMAGTTGALPPGTTNLGTDLSDDHPVSFAYSASLVSGDAELLPAASILPPVGLDRNGEVQCTSCHEPHDNTFGTFLVRSNQESSLCKSCHVPRSWDSSAHAKSSSLVSPDIAALLGADSISVAANACKSCHRNHGAPGKPWLLGRLNITSLCTTCHNGSVARSDIAREILKLSNHGMSDQGIPEGTGTPFVEGNTVSCADCHNPHAAGSAESLAPGLPASLARVPGVTRDGAEVTTISKEYELCYRCHGDAPVRTRDRKTRVITQDNKRLQFQLGNPSYHPVGIPGVNPNVPSLIPPYLTSSLIRCGDCHGSDSSRLVGGSGPAGPHGSAFRPMLSLRYDQGDFTPESPAAYALCYRCHQRESILGDFSFHEHKKHIVEERTPCSVCHDPHGVYSAQGTSRSNWALINFDRSIVFPNSNGRLEFVKLGAYHGECYLSCHGEDHHPEGY